MLECRAWIVLVVTFAMRVEIAFLINARFVNLTVSEPGAALAGLGGAKSLELRRCGHAGLSHDGRRTSQMALGRV